MKNGKVKLDIDGPVAVLTLNDPSALNSVSVPMLEDIQAALDANPDVAEKLKTGDMRPIGVIVGFVMKETKGRADGKEVTKVTRQILGL